MKEQNEELIVHLPMADTWWPAVEIQPTKIDRVRRWFAKLKGKV